MLNPEKPLNLADPARYRIRIQGYLDNTWANELGQLTFTNYVSPQRPVVTVINGQVMDQAELLWILRQLYGLGFPLLSVECLDVDKTS